MPTTLNQTRHNRKGGLEGGEGGEGVYWIPAKAAFAALQDPTLWHELEATTWRDGLLGPSAPPSLVAHVWMRACTDPGSSVHGMRALLLLVGYKAGLQRDALAFLELRRMAAGTDGEERAKLVASMDEAARKVAQQLPEPAKALQQLTALRDVRDNRVAVSLLQALALGARSEVRVLCVLCVLCFLGGVGVGPLRQVGPHLTKAAHLPPHEPPP